MAKNTSQRERLTQRLEELATLKIPKELMPGAMCYRMAAPPQYAEYMCPIDGQRTNHIKSRAVFIERALPQIISLLAQIPILTVDASEYCGKCHPHVKNPEVVLRVCLPDEGRGHLVRGISTEDALILNAFFNGRATWNDEFGSEHPLKKQRKRLKKLLGL